jgi:hypothetical protein
VDVRNLSIASHIEHRWRCSKSQHGVSNNLHKHLAISPAPEFVTKKFHSIQQSKTARFSARPIQSL